MKIALEALYASILSFLLKAYDWYNEGKISHFLHSFTRPLHRVHADLVDEIAAKSRKIDKLAGSASQAELRVMHKRIADIQAQLQLVTALQSEPRDLHNIFAAIQSQLHLSDTKMDDIVKKMTCEFKLEGITILKKGLSLYSVSISRHPIKYHARYQPKSLRSSNITNTHPPIKCSA